MRTSASRGVDQLFSHRAEEQLELLDHSSAFEEYLCECGDSACGASVTLSHDEYRWIRRQPGCSVVLPGHWVPRRDRVVNTHPRYQVIARIDESDRARSTEYLHDVVVGEQVVAADTLRVELR